MAMTYQEWIDTYDADYPNSPREALEQTIKQWKGLADRPHGVPCLTMKSYVDCPLCVYHFDGEMHSCTSCPAYDKNSKCYKTPEYEAMATLNNTAPGIQLLEKWLDETKS